MTDTRTVARAPVAPPTDAAPAFDADGLDTPADGPEARADGPGRPDAEPWRPIGFAPGTAGGRRPLAAVRRAVRAALRGDQLHVCAIDEDGGLWHTLRHPDGSWQALGADVSASLGGLGPVRGAAVTPAGARLLVTTVGGDGRLLHAVRFADGTWRRGPAPTTGPGPGLVDAALAADCGGRRVHVLVVDAAGRLWHTVRRADGPGREAFAAVTAADRLGGDGPAASRVAAVVESGRLQVVVSTAGGEVWHGCRAADGSWGRFAPVALPDTGSDATPDAEGHRAARPVAVAAADGRVHVLAVDAGRVWHAVRSADGEWRPSVGAVDVVDALDEGCPAATAVAARAAGGRLHVLATTADGRMWHTVRASNGRWQAAFGDALTITDPPALTGAAC